MQDNCRGLIKNRKGVMDLPIRLMIVMLILSISIPFLADAVDSNDRNMMDAEMNQEVKKITNAISVVHFSGNGSSRVVNIDLPAGCEIIVGGDGSDAYSIRSIYNGSTTSTTYFEKPTVKIPKENILTGHMTLILKSTYYGNTPGIEVTLI